ncbi:nucleotide exchange factor GrpE [Oscillospiraceae bacterium PP1C4]
MSDKNKHEEKKISQEPVETVETENVKEETSEIPQTEEASQTPKEPEKTEAELLGEKLADLNEKLLRTMAEYDNFRKRSQREKEAIYPQAIAGAVSQFVPIIDTFERALALPCSDVEFKKGVEMILQNFKEVLVKLGVEEFGAAGDLFDPEMHNAVMHIEDDSLDANTIAEVFQKGYKLGDRIVRHAMVKVAN